ncbi:MAG: sugar transferase, partial [Candidatus Eisenbacteria bacterium]|nr:sugar transferase [Candidatus Eisenbacteria bacterium]
MSGRESAPETALDLGPLPERPAEGFYARFAKPALDRSIATVAAIALAPLFLVIALAIRIDGPGGVLFRQQRIGLLGRAFTILKFRTMVPGAQRLGTGMLVTENDPRVTRVGRVLRALSLDELPQIWNIARGEMSFVGPRPTLAYQVKQYDSFQRQRLRLRPGLTGYAQVRGRKSLPWDERIRLDVLYLERISFWTDLSILFATVRVVLRAEDPPAPADYWKEKRSG